jgi:hypothetical protein
MGNTINQSAADGSESNTTTNTSKHASPQQVKTPNYTQPSHSPAELAVKSADIKLNDIYAELKKLEAEVATFEGTKSEKKYVKLEEFLTICLLKLDEIDRNDETINQRRKKIINFCHEISDNLEKRASAASQLDSEQNQS